MEWDRLTLGHAIRVLVAGMFCVLFGCGEPALSEGDFAPVPEGKYRVRDGDMLSKIAQREYENGNLWYVLLNANPDLKTRPNFTLYAGEVINLPKIDDIDRSIPEAAVPKELPAQYIILPWDSLRSIAQRCYGDDELWMTIYEANQDVLSERVLDDTRNLVAGQVITIPARPE